MRRLSFRRVERVAHAQSPDGKAEQRGDWQVEGASATEEPRRPGGACAESPKGRGSSTRAALCAPCRAPGDGRRGGAGRRGRCGGRAGGGEPERGRAYRPGDFG